MREYQLNTLKPGENYSAKELDSFVSTTDVILVSSNTSELFSDPDREYKVTMELDGCFEHSSTNGEKQFRNKRVYVVEKT
ncbi:hypothetical protein [Bacillus taeanensis]|uniref:Uncharacterized protein n=1 Tax=Bacillus taeanensis TaxID=273032 RepID=A0A366XXF7_9BACI|nr:hypothetical protein [Bacillus taeanensis]RBW69835.1 hypothetical protein DS031_09920 [Bacillus taeanensis]